MTRNIEFKKTNCLIVTADDMGRSTEVNTAIIEAHRSGILTAASIMAGGPAFEEAVRIASECHGLSVGLHVTLCDGKAVLPPERIPDLVDRDGYFEESPEKAWMSCRGPRILSQVEAEVKAQFDRLDKAGIHPSHVDAHHHLQMHPRIFEIICKQASLRGVGWIRVPNEPLTVVLGSRSLSRGLMPFVEWVVFRILRAYNSKVAKYYGMNVVCFSLGLSWTGSIDKISFLNLMDCAKGPVNEIFTHPDVSTDMGRLELEALTSVSVRNKAALLGAALVGYKELSRGKYESASHFRIKEKGATTP